MTAPAFRDFSHVTVRVSDIERSLAFYRDALGLKVIYDQVIAGENRSLRLVLLRANDTFVGNLGLLQRLTPAPAPVPLEYRRAGVGDVILVINVKDLDQRLPRHPAGQGARRDLPGHPADLAARRQRGHGADHGLPGRPARAGTH